MDQAQLAALTAASSQLTNAQTALQQANAALVTANTAHATAVNAGIANDVTLAAAVVTQAQVAVLLRQGDVDTATAAVNAMMIKPAKAFKPNGQPPSFDMDADKDNFHLFRTRWDLYIRLSTIDEGVAAHAREQYKATLLLSSLAPNTLNAVVNARLGDAAMASSTLILQYLEDRCNAGKNKHVWRQQFSACIQRPNLSVDSWMCELREIARKCEFATGCCHLCEPERILGQIIFGLADNEVRVKLLEVGPGLTLDHAVNVMRTLEMSKQQAEQIQPGGAVHAVRAKSTYKRDKNAKVTKAAADAVKAPAATGKPKCGDCGLEIRPTGHNCPAKRPGSTCEACNQPGHFKAVCPAKPKITAIFVRQVTANNDDTVTVSIIPSKGPAADLMILPDTGSSIDAIPPAIFNDRFKDVQLRSGIHAETATGDHIESLGSFTASIDWVADDGILRPLNRPSTSSTSSHSLSFPKRHRKNSV